MSERLNLESGIEGIIAVRESRESGMHALLPAECTECVCTPQNLARSSRSHRGAGRRGWERAAAVGGSTVHARTALTANDAAGGAGVSGHASPGGSP